MAAKEILKMDETIEIPVEVILIKNWKDKNRMVRGEVIPEKNTIHNLVNRKGQIQWRSSEELMKLVFDDTNLRSVFYLCQKDFPKLLSTSTSREVFQMAETICEREHWNLDRWHIEAALNNIEMDL